MQKKLTILFIFICWISHSQHTERYKKITSSLKPIDSIKIDLKYRNGKIKETGFIKVYKHNGVKYEYFSGKQICYYKSGKMKSFKEFDSFGVLINSELYDIEGFPYCRTKALKIDTNANNLDAFFKSKEHLLVSEEFKRYRFSLIPSEWFLLEEGETVNGEKKGKWIRYNKDGTVKKTYQY